MERFFSQTVPFSLPLPYSNQQPAEQNRPRRNGIGKQQKRQAIQIHLFGAERPGMPPHHPEQAIGHDSHQGPDNTRCDRINPQIDRLRHIQVTPGAYTPYHGRQQGPPGLPPPVKGKLNQFPSPVESSSTKPPPGYPAPKHAQSIHCEIGCQKPKHRQRKIQFRPHLPACYTLTLRTLFDEIRLAQTATYGQANEVSAHDRNHILNQIRKRRH